MKRSQAEPLVHTRLELYIPKEIMMPRLVQYIKSHIMIKGTQGKAMKSNTI